MLKLFVLLNFRLLRSVILGLACSVDLQECKEQATIQFSQWMNNPNDRPHPDIRNHVYYYGENI